MINESWRSELFSFSRGGPEPKEKCLSQNDQIQRLTPIAAGQTHCWLGGGVGLKNVLAQHDYSSARTLSSLGAPSPVRVRVAVHVTRRLEGITEYQPPPAKQITAQTLKSC